MKKIIVTSLILFPLTVFSQFKDCGFVPADVNVALHSGNILFANRAMVDTSTLLRIPVVIHVLHLKNSIGSAVNPSKERIRETISYLNKTFNASWTSYPDTLSGGVNLRIEFVLATKDTSGRPFDGIDRIDATGYPNYLKYGRIERELLLNTLWNKYRYFNIWLAHKIEGGRSFGIPPEPPTAPVFNVDGIVLVANRFLPGDPLIVHETGHYLGLMHTWGIAAGNACPANMDCETEGDFICDTEPHPESASCGLIGSINPCTGNPYGNTLRNFMSYSEQNCWDRFTRLQRIRMRATILSLRPGIPGNEATVISPASFNEMNHFFIGPNPGSGSFNIQLKVPLKDPFTLSVINSSGQIMYQKNMTDLSQTSFTLTPGHLNAGIYFIVLQDKTSRQSQIVIIQ